ncbi:MAG: zinc-dependent metalloprotease family protein [Planctomycetota bacterium]
MRANEEAIRSGLRSLPSAALLICGLLLATWPATTASAAEPAGEWVDIDARALQRAASGGVPFRLALRDRVLELDVKVRPLRSAKFFLTASPPGALDVFPLRPSATYSGAVRGVRASDVRLSEVADEFLRGQIRMDDEWWLITPAPERGAGQHHVVAASELTDDTPLLCGAEVLLDLAPASVAGTATVHEAGAPEPELAAVETFKVLEVAVDADHEYFLRYGSGTVAEIEATMNAADAVLREQLGVTIEIAHINIWADAGDPYEAFAAAEIMAELRGYWLANFAHVERDSVHLFSGREFTGSASGLAYSAVACRLDFAFSLTEDFEGLSFMHVVVAHELGHILGASHDTSTPPPLYIMHPQVSGATLSEFSTSSRDQIAGYLGTVSCLALVDSDGVSIDTQPAAPPPKKGGGGAVDALTIGGILALSVLVGAARVCRRRRTSGYSEPA